GRRDGLGDREDREQRRAVHGSVAPARERSRPRLGEQVRASVHGDLGSHLTAPLGFTQKLRESLGQRRHQRRFATRAPSTVACMIRRGASASPIVNTFRTPPARARPSESFGFSPQAITTVTSSTKRSAPENVSTTRAPPSRTPTSFCTRETVTPFDARRW